MMVYFNSTTQKYVDSIHLIDLIPLMPRQLPLDADLFHAAALVIFFIHLSQLEFHQINSKLPGVFKYVVYFFISYLNVFFHMKEAHVLFLHLRLLLNF